MVEFWNIVIKVNQKTADVIFSEGLSKQTRFNLFMVLLFSLCRLDGEDMWDSTLFRAHIHVSFLLNHNHVFWRKFAKSHLVNNLQIFLSKSQGWTWCQFDILFFDRESKTNFVSLVWFFSIFLLFWWG